MKEIKLIKNVSEITLELDFDLRKRGNTIREAVQDQAVFTYDYKTFWAMYENNDYEDYEDYEDDLDDTQMYIDSECKEEKFMKLNIKYLVKPYTYTSQDQKDYIEVKVEEYQMFNKACGCAI